MAKKIALVSKECVACGSCLKACPLQAISIFKGSHAIIDAAKCVGCGKCQRACPASVISITEREES
ncbi:MAG: 4Fe-4S dicluster domain-containing protein [Anaerovorax sp.]|nr:4Fe-4S dicluster domain-containing protein [Anaerovorax sp.]